MNLISHVVVTKNGIGYASDIQRNGLFKIDMETGNSTYICAFPNESILKARIHAYAFWAEDKIYFAPQEGNNISVYHTETGKIETIKIPQFSKIEFSYYNPRMKFTKIIFYGGYLWMIPATYPGIIKLNPETNEILLINNWLSKDSFMFRRAVYTIGNKLYAASGNNNKVLIFDLETESGKITKVGKKNKGVVDMCQVDSFFIMAPRLAGTIVKWNPQSNIIEEFNDYPPGFIPGKTVFERIYEYKSDIIITPGWANYCICLSDNGLVKDEKVKWRTVEKSAVLFMFETDTRRYYREFLNGETFRFYYVDKDSNLLSECRFNIENIDDRRRSVVMTATDNKEVIKESSLCDLNDLIKIFI